MPFKLTGDPNAEHIHLGHDLGYYQQRDMWLDCRGPLHIDKGCHIAIKGTEIVTCGHHPTGRSSLGPLTYHPVVIENKAVVYGGCYLYNCVIGPSAIVMPHAVVHGVYVGERQVVQGNPAKIVGYVGSKGIVWIDEPLDLPRMIWETSGWSHLKEIAIGLE